MDCYRNDNCQDCSQKPLYEISQKGFAEKGREPENLPCLQNGLKEREVEEINGEGGGDKPPSKQFYWGDNPKGGE